MLKVFNQILKIVSARRKITFLFFIFITFISSLVDVISIGLIIPFIGLFLDYNETVAIVSKFNFLNLSLEEPGIYYLITILFILTIIISTIIRIIQSYFGTRLSDMLRYEISSNFYFKLINLKFLNHNYINENNASSNIQKINFVSGFISSFLSFITHLLNLIFIGVLIILINVELLIYLLILAFSLLLFNQFFKNLLINNGKLISSSIDERTKILNNTIGYLPFIMLNNLTNFFYSIFTKKEYQISKSNLFIVFFNKTPNLIYISIVTIVISIMVLYYKMSLPDEIFMTNITIFSGILIALMRSLPQLINLQGSLSTLRSYKKPTEDVLQYINKFKVNHYNFKKKIIYKNIKTIEFKNLNYNYKNKNKKIILIKNLNIKINKGDKIFISGDSGSGKTTILKLILGLLKPDTGSVYINSKKINYNIFSNINKKISYVPQDIFLFNDSFFNNLTLGADHADHKKVIKYCETVKIHDFISRKRKKYNSEVSHYARNISGGQKQRIGIARALIREPEILVLDESTNSMDQKTELQVFKNIKKELKDKTIICVSHNKNLSKLFDKYYILKNNKLINAKKKNFNNTRY